MIMRMLTLIPDLQVRLDDARNRITALRVRPLTPQTTRRDNVIDADSG